MGKAPFYNLSGISCWITNLNPGENGISPELQQECRERGVFGIGWAHEDAEKPEFPLKGETPLTDEWVEKWISLWDEKEKNACAAAIRNMRKVKAGDLVIMRLKDSHYYLGRAAGPAFFIQKDGPRDKNGRSILSWACRVEDGWLDLGLENKLPGEIVGRLTQRHQRTITPINTNSEKITLLLAYLWEKNGRKSIFKDKVQPVYLDRHSFADALTYMKLEDLAAEYIYRRHESEGYHVLPSSCKATKMQYEFDFVNAQGKYISCQVKNRKEIEELENYTCDARYEKIYLFSGLWSDEKVKELNTRDLKGSRVYAISHGELFETMRESAPYLLDEYHRIAAEPESFSISDTADWKKEGPESYEKIRRYKKGRKSGFFPGYIREDERGFLYFGSTKLYYSQEFRGLIKTGDVPEEDVENALKALGLDAAGEEI